MSKKKIGEFEIDIDKALSKINDICAEKVLLQLPDGLKRSSGKIIEILEENDLEVKLWGSTCYGACDLPDHIGDADLLIHVGHSEIPNLNVGYPVIYLECRSKIWNPPPEEFFEKLKGKVALYSSIQHLDHMYKMEELLEEKGFETVIGEGDQRIKYPGQVLGCNYSTKVPDADTQLYIGTGKFHPIGLSLSLERDVLIYNPVTGEFTTTGDKRDRLLRKRFAIINAAEDAQRIGVIISHKKGQRREEILDEFKGDDYDIIVAEFDEVVPQLVDDFQWDCAVNTACPRIALDDNKIFRTRILTPLEFLISKKKKDWKDWEMDEIH